MEKTIGILAGIAAAIASASAIYFLTGAEVGTALALGIGGGAFASLFCSTFTNKDTGFVKAALIGAATLVVIGFFGLIAAAIAYSAFLAYIGTFAIVGACAGLAYRAAVGFYDFWINPIPTF